MRKSSRNFTRFLAPALLLGASLSLHGTAARADNGFAIDGYLSNDQNSGCMVLREHDGGTRLLAGSIGGLQAGDHTRLYVHRVNGSVCNVRGNAYEVSEVLTLWGDDRHKTTVYDHLTDGSFSDYIYRSQGNGYGYNPGVTNSQYRQGYRDDRSYYRDDNRGDLISLRGRLSDDEGGACPVLRTRDGQVWNLEGDLSRFRDHARVRVVGWSDPDSRCGCQTLRVRRMTSD